MHAWRWFDFDLDVPSERQRLCDNAKVREPLRENDVVPDAVFVNAVEWRWQMVTCPACRIAGDLFRRDGDD